MVFSSLTFLYLFLPLCLLCYAVVPTLKGKNLTLTLFSLLFYAWGEPKALFLLILCAAVNYLAGRMMGRTRRKTVRRRWLTAALALSLGILIVFKYLGLLADTFSAVTGVVNRLPAIALPIGISFYTFQCLSYTIDVYRGDAEVQRSFPDFLLFVSLFPQLIAGPILRYSDLAAQLSCRTHTPEKTFRGLLRFCCGLGKKVALANYAGEVADRLLTGGSAASLWLGILLYTFQIYFDFSGYSDMAIGLGRIFGFEYCENFNYPYVSRSVTEFWRRWHISLGTFFRDYVYIPLGGKYRHQLRNIAVVWALTGIWHGASWNFLLWGLYYAVLLLLEKLFLLKLLAKLPKAVGWVYTAFTVLIGWTLFYFTDIRACLGALGTMFGGGALTDPSFLTTLKTNAAFLVLCAVACLPWCAQGVSALFGKLRSPDGGASAAEYAAGTVYCLALLALCTALIASSSYNPFLYFRF